VLLRLLDDPTIASKSWVVAWSPPAPTMAFNTFCLVADIVGFFASLAWLFAIDPLPAVHEMHQSLRGWMLGVVSLTAVSGALALAKAGADVVHLDASPKSITQARENASLSGLDAAPIRWITDDAMKFVERELRRGSKYDVIVLDPPKFGRGPKNETWRFEQDFPKLLDHTRTLLSDNPLFVIATVYAVRLSYAAVAQAIASAMPAGNVVSGEMAIRESSTRDIILPTGLFARWTP
jgi:23S rRNA (cytosine1962-C5)-methyltransferase